MATDNWTVAEIVEKMRAAGKFYDGVFFDLANLIEKAHNREIAAKDAEIANLKKRIDEYERQPELMAETAREALRTLQEQDAEIAGLRKLVKEMAVALKFTSRNYFECEERMCVLCGKKCGRNEAIRLINEARNTLEGANDGK